MGSATVSNGILSASQINKSHGQEFDVVIVKPDGSTIEKHHNVDMSMTGNDQWEEIIELFDEYGDKERLFNLAPSQNESKEKYDKITRLSIKDGYIVFEPKASNHYILNNHKKNTVELLTLESAQKIQKEINVLRENVNNQDQFLRMLPITLDVIEKQRKSVSPSYGADYTKEDVESTLREQLQAAIENDFNVDDINNAFSIEMSKLSWIAQSTSIVKQLRNDATVSKYGAVAASMQKPRETHTDNFVRFDIPFTAQEVQQVMAVKGITNEEAVAQFNATVREWASEYHAEPGVVAKRSYMISDLQVNANDPHVHVQVACQSICNDELTGIPIIFSAGQKEVRAEFDKVLVPRLKQELGITMTSMYGERTIIQEPQQQPEPQMEPEYAIAGHPETVTQMAKSLGINKTGMSASDTMHVIRSMPLGDLQLSANKALKVIEKEEQELLAEKARIELALQEKGTKKEELYSVAEELKDVSKFLALSESIASKEAHLDAIAPLYQKAHEQITAIVEHPAFADSNKDEILDTFAETVIKSHENNEKIERAMATVEKFDWINVDGLEPADVMVAVVEEGQHLIDEAKTREEQIKAAILHNVEDKENAKFIEDPVELVDFYIDEVNDNFNEVEARAIEAEKKLAEMEARMEAMAIAHSEQLNEISTSFTEKFKELSVSSAAISLQAEKMQNVNRELSAKNVELTEANIVAEQRAQSFETLYHNQKNAITAAIVERMPNDDAKMLVQASMAADPVNGINEAFDTVQSQINVLQNEKRASANAIAKLGEKLNEKFGMDVELTQNTAVSINRISDSVDTIENNDKKHKEHMTKVLNAFHKQFGNTVPKEQLVEMFNNPQKFIDTPEKGATERFRQGVEQAQTKKTEQTKGNKNDDPDNGPKM